MFSFMGGAIVISAKDLGVLFNSYRKATGRKTLATEILEKLDYEDAKRISVFHFDAFLIKATEDAFESQYMDIDVVLMAFGLLQEYEHFNYKIEARRHKFLKNSNYLRKYPYIEKNKEKEEKIYISYNELNKKQKDDCIAKLGKTESERFKDLAKFILDCGKISENMKNLDDYLEINEAQKITGVKMPRPMYVQNNILPLSFESQTDFELSQKIDRIEKMLISICKALGVAVIVLIFMSGLSYFNDRDSLQSNYPFVTDYEEPLFTSKFNFLDDKNEDRDGSSTERLNNL